ncbi:MAG: hypothetical protein ABUL73_03920 [Alphaproteobacteria bacterium]
MVSSITPGTTGAATLGLDPRFSKHHNRSGGADQAGVANDQVTITDAASWRAVRESVNGGVSQLQQTLALGDDARDFLGQVQTLASSSDPDAQGQLDQLISDYSAKISGAVQSGVSLAAGDDLSVQAEPGAPPVMVSGVDLSLKSNPSSSDVIKVASDAKVGADTADAARASQLSLNGELERLSDMLNALQAHQGFVGAAEGVAPNVNGDLDADSARLVALQVQQGLASIGGSIATADPSAVLALFKS